MRNRIFAALVFGLLTLALPSISASASPQVTLARVPDGGLQPQVVVRGATVHLIYFKGNIKAGDIFYVRSSDSGATWTAPLRVNSQMGSAIAIGTIRGATLAVGRKGRIFVAWNGSDKALPRNPATPASLRSYGAAPLLFSRLNDAGDAFETQRNVLTKTFNLDGGGCVAADEEGHVYLAWHANDRENQEEDGRQVFLATSNDDGVSFSPEKALWNQPTGACGCCQLRIEAQNGGKVGLLYRSSTDIVHRDTYFLVSNDRGKTFSGQKIHEWNIGACPMSSFSLVLNGEKRIAAWETAEQIYFSPLDTTGKATKISSAPSKGENRKYPALSVNDTGETLLLWTQGTAWNRGGSLLWQVYDAAFHPIEGFNAVQNGVPAWSFATAFAQPNGNFTVLY